MAPVTATLRDFSILDNEPFVQGSSADKRVLLRFVFDNGSTQVAGGTDTLDIAVNTAAESRMRQGLTLTPRSWQLVQPLIGAAARWGANVVSWKVHCKAGIPQGADVVCFHGRPRPWEIGL